MGPRYWYQQVPYPGSLKMQIQSFFISFWRTKSSRAFSWSSLVQWSNPMIVPSLKATKSHFKIASKWEQSTQFFCLNLLYMKHLVLRMLVHVHHISLEQFQSRIYSLLPPHQPRVETWKAATKLLLQFSTTIERLGKNGRRFEDRRYHSTWFEEPSYWLLLYTHIPFICMIGWFSWYSLFIPLTALDDGFLSDPKHQTRKEVQQVQRALSNCFILPYHCSKQRHITCFLPAFQVSSRRSCITAHFFFCLASSSILASDKVLTIMA